MIADITLLQGLLIYIIGFLITLVIFKFIHYYDSYMSPNDTLEIVLFCIFWPIVIPVMFLLGIIIVIYKYVEWFLTE